MDSSTDSPPHRTWGTRRKAPLCPPFLSGGEFCGVRSLARFADRLQAARRLEDTDDSHMTRRSHSGDLHSREARHEDTKTRRILLPRDFRAFVPSWPVCRYAVLLG